MKCSVYIATSADGYIAKIDGSVDWLQTAGNLDADMSEHTGLDFGNFLSTVDCLIMGRKCMEMISRHLTTGEWIYGDIPIIVLTNTLKEPPENLIGKVEMYSGGLPDLLKRLERSGYKHAYIDGGSTITSFINLGLIDELTITQVPVLLGEGIPLFGKLTQDVKLGNSQATVYPNGFVQIKYEVQ